MNDLAWINAALAAARPQAVGALLRYFRDLDRAEEAFQEAALRALKNWPQNGPPRDPTAWLILVGRNAALDGVRKQSRTVALPDEDAISDLDDVEAPLAERLDGSHYRDDVLRLLFICCHPDLPATQQIALALRIVSGLTVKQIARAFLVSEAAMEQRITRAKQRVARADVPFEAPGPVERSQRLAAVMAMVYLVFNEGYSAGDSEARAALCDEAIRLSRLLLRLFQTEPEVMGLAALMILQHARSHARFDAEGEAVLLEDQDRSRWNGELIGEGLALMDKAMRHNRPGPYSDPGRHRRHPRPRGAGVGHRLERDRCFIRGAGADAALAGGDAQSRGGHRQGARTASGAGHDRAAGNRAGQLFPLSYAARGARSCCSWARPPKRGRTSTGPSPWPTPRRKRRLFAAISTVICSPRNNPGVRSRS